MIARVAIETAIAGGDRFELPGVAAYGRIVR